MKQIQIGFDGIRIKVTLNSSSRLSGVTDWAISGACGFWFAG